jgi:CrcB protein
MGGYEMTMLAVFVGAGLGGLTRYGISEWIHHSAGPAFPWGTLVINVSGSLLLTFVYAVLEGTAAAPEWRAFLGVGLLGGYTTFSTFSYETVRLIQDGDWSRAGLYVGASVVASLGAAIIGFNLGLSFLRRG